MTTNTYRELIGDYFKVVDAIYGTYLDATDGFSRVADKAEKDLAGAQHDWEEMRQRNTQLRQFDQPDFIKSFSRLTQKGADGPHHLHGVDFNEYIARNTVGGRNWIYIANSSIVAIYQYWESGYRPKIESVHDLDRDGLQIPIFSDLRHLRNSIIHNRGRAKQEVSGCEVLSWFKPNDEISLTKDTFEELIDKIRQTLGQLQNNPEKFSEA